ncbi:MULTISPECIES: hypothetical protein [Moorena]|nr:MULTISPECIES: hypothetical protein [Moorena]
MTYYQFTTLLGINGILLVSPLTPLKTVDPKLEQSQQYWLMV